MRITKKQLQRIIKEELENVLSEGAFDDLIDITRKVIEKALEVGGALVRAFEDAGAQGRRIDRHQPVCLPSADRGNGLRRADR